MHEFTGLVRVPCAFCHVPRETGVKGTVVLEAASREARNETIEEPPDV